MDAQTIFNQVANHLFTQGRRAREKGLCVYRAEDGSRCAVGAILEDDEYQPSMEGFGVYDLLDNKLLPERLQPHVELLRHLQSAHDTCHHWDSDGDMLEELADIAETHGLDSAVLADLKFPPESA